MRTGTWRFDQEGVVARNDVVYDQPLPEAWKAMPVGGGDLVDAGDPHDLPAPAGGT